mgnify:CR=1 FL=1
MSCWGMRGICGMGGRLEMSGELEVWTPGGVTDTIALELFTDGGSVDRFSTYTHLQLNKLLLGNVGGARLVNARQKIKFSLPKYSVEF